jgi:hypothetical protein
LTTKTEKQIASDLRGEVRVVGEPFEALCPFRIGTTSSFDRDNNTLQAAPQRTFKPRGLMLWGVPDGACVNVFVGRDLELVVEYGPIPAKWFAAFESFAQVAAAVDAGKEPPGWGKWDVVHPGLFIRLEFSTRDGQRLDAREIQALMWGHVLPFRHPFP